MIASLYLDVFCDSSNVINWQYALFTETKMHVAATEGIGGGGYKHELPLFTSTFWMDQRQAKPV